MTDKNKSQALITSDPWQAMRQLTPARIAQGRAGGSLPTHELIDFQLAHALACDAVDEIFDAQALASSIETLNIQTIIVNSAAPDHTTFLRRPDLGKQPSEEARCQLQAQKIDKPVDLVITVSNGLSALAVHRQVVPLLRLLLPKLYEAQFAIAPIVLVRFGRVAIEDDIGQLVGARLALMLIGERPGLGAPDSLGAYLVYDPKPGQTDAQRNCISNIRPQGLSFEVAAQTIAYLLAQSRSRQISGVQLKDDRVLN